MKRKIFSILFALVLVLSFSLIPSVPAAAATTISVVPGPGTPIQNAINAANPDDTIIVAPGTYPENVVIGTSNLTLQSETVLGAIIQPAATAPGWPSAAVVITADGVTVDGFEIDGTTVAKNGILGWETSGLVIKNNKIHGAVNAWDGCGILLFSWGSGGTVYNNLIQDNEVYDTGRMGIMVMDYSTEARVGYWPGYYTVTSGNTITGNTVHDVWKKAMAWGDGSMPASSGSVNAACAKCPSPQPRSRIGRAHSRSPIIRASMLRRSARNAGTATRCSSK